MRHPNDHDLIGTILMGMPVLLSVDGNPSNELPDLFDPLRKEDDVVPDRQKSRWNPFQQGARIIWA